MDLKIPFKFPNKKSLEMNTELKEKLNNCFENLTQVP